MDALYVITATCLLAAVLFLVVARRRQARRKSWLLLGPNGSGKTALLYKLSSGRLLKTVSSIETNALPVTVEHDGRAAHVQLVDIPGHDEVRFDFRKFAKSSAGIIMLVDSANLERDARKAGEILFDALDFFRSFEPASIFDKTFVPPVLVLCNKQDLLSSLSKHQVKALLEQELRMRQKSGSLGGSQAMPTIVDWDKVEFVESHLGTNAKVAVKGLDEVRKFMVRHTSKS